MIKSMTAYARADFGNDSLSVSVELRSYNSRYFDTVMRLPSHLGVMEEKIKSRIKETVDRGRIEVNLKINELSGSPVTYQLDARRAAAYYEVLSNLRQLLSIETPVTIEQIIGLKDVIKPVDPEDDTISYWPQIDECLQRALIDLNRMRQKEGEYIASDIKKRIETISRHLTNIKAGSSGMLDVYRDRLMERITTLTHGIVDIDSGRIAQEAAILAERSDITEEIVRAASHIDQFLTIMSSDGTAGRKLNFLLQELNREINTIGSKTDKSGVAHLVVDVKSELEKIREQVQNVE